MSDKYDVIIVGGGPAGIFAALQLAQVEGVSILLVEKGKDLDSDLLSTEEADGYQLPQPLATV